MEAARSMQQATRAPSWPAICPECETELEEVAGVCPACYWVRSWAAAPSQFEPPDDTSFTERYGGPADELQEALAGNTPIARGRVFVIVVLIVVVLVAVGLIVDPFGFM